MIILTKRSVSNFLLANEKSILRLLSQITSFKAKTNKELNNYHFSCIHLSCKKQKNQNKKSYFYLHNSIRKQLKRFSFISLQKVKNNPTYRYLLIHRKYQINFIWLQKQIQVPIQNLFYAPCYQGSKTNSQLIQSNAKCNKTAIQFVNNIDRVYYILNNFQSIICV
ncbi:unnamed protein product [Paramecium sonneborni]|uniref:Uncharacterized protein n=1 Tax=Paramecium sonneborni TaxID=65129 RepID=A0A8S1PU28_9CILI|nr:unnamed protein product [Paramecium sonneborni]